jgi:hypothetical protein
MQFDSVLCLCCCLAALLPAEAFFCKRGSTRAVRTAKSCLELRGGQTLSPPMGHPKSKPLNPPAPAVDDAGDGDSSDSEDEKLEALRMDGFDIDNEDAHLYDDGDFDSYESSEEDESAAEGNSHANLQEMSDSD